MDRSGRIAAGMGLAAVFVVCVAGLFLGQDPGGVFVRAVAALVIFGVIGKMVGWMADRILAGNPPPEPPGGGKPAQTPVTPPAQDGGTDA